jgi:hypothetical protein
VVAANDFFIGVVSHKSWLSAFTRMRRLDARGDMIAADD